MTTLVRVSLVTTLITFGAIAAGCPVSPSSANAAVPSPAPAADSPEQVVMEVARGISEGRPYVAWDALPNSYQDDITDLVHGFAAKVDPEMWNKGFEIVRKSGDMLQKQRDVILGMPKIKDSSGFDAERVAREWDHIVAPFITIANSDLANVDAMKTMDVRSFLGTTGAQLMEDMLRIGEFAEDEANNKFAALGQTRATLVSRDGDTATVEIDQPGESVKIEQFVRVEGKWIPKDLADDWEKQMGEAREQIAQMSPEKVQSIKPQIMTMLAGIDSTVDQLDQAQSPEQFEQTLQMGMFQIFGGIMAISQAMDSGDDMH